MFENGNVVCMFSTSKQEPHLKDGLNICWWCHTGQTQGKIEEVLSHRAETQLEWYEEWNSWVPGDLRHKERTHMCMSLSVWVYMSETVTKHTHYLLTGRLWMFCMRLSEKEHGKHMHPPTDMCACGFTYACSDVCSSQVEKLSKWKRKLSFNRSKLGEPSTVYVVNDAAHEREH